MDCPTLSDPSCLSVLCNVYPSTNPSNRSILYQSIDWRSLFFRSLIDTGLCTVIPQNLRNISMRKAEAAFDEIRKTYQDHPKKLFFLKKCLKKEDAFERLLQNGYFRLANALIGPGFDVHRTYSYSQSAMTTAAASLQPSVVAELIRYNAPVNGVLDPTNPRICLATVPLMAALYPIYLHNKWPQDEQERRQLSIVQLLIQSQADVNIQKKMERLPYSLLLISSILPSYRLFSLIKPTSTIYRTMAKPP